MDSKNKILQIFKLIRELNTPPAKSVQQLVSRLGSSSSAVYRDIKILEVIGYPINKDNQNRRSLKFTMPKSGNGVLTLEDIEYLQELLERQISNNIRAKLILEKFNRDLNLIPLADALPQLHQNHVLQMVRIGINTDHRLKLNRYRSLTSNTTRNRLVEPLEITEDERYLIAWDVEEDDQRQFKINRIQDVDVLNEKNNLGKVATPMDLFGLTGETLTPVRLRLSHLAHHLLLEEFPLSRPLTRRTNKGIIFDGLVRSWKGIGRFVLGLPGEVEVLEPEEFKVYLKKRLGEF